MIDILDSVVEELKEQLSIEIVYYRDKYHYVEGNLCIAHLSTSIDELLQQLVNREEIEYVVISYPHSQKAPAITWYLDKVIIILPTFYYDKEKKIQSIRGVALLRNDGEIKYVRTKPSSERELVNYWCRFKNV